MPFWRKKIGRTYTRSSTIENNKDNAKPQARSTAALNERAHLLDYEVIAKKLKANIQDGLTDAEAESRLEEYVPRQFLCPCPGASLDVILDMERTLWRVERGSPQLRS